MFPFQDCVHRDRALSRPDPSAAKRVAFDLGPLSPSKKHHPNWQSPAEERNGGVRTTKPVRGEAAVPVASKESQAQGGDPQGELEALNEMYKTVSSALARIDVLTCRRRAR